MTGMDMRKNKNNRRLLFILFPPFSSLKVWKGIRICQTWLISYVSLQEAGDRKLDNKEEKRGWETRLPESGATRGVIGRTREKRF